MQGSFAKQSFYSLLSAAIPIVLGLLLLPFLLSRLGVEKFGIFSLAAAILGYSAILDFGMSRILSRTTALAEPSTPTHLAKTVFSVVGFNFLVSALVAGLALFFLEDVIQRFFSQPASSQMASESKLALLWILLSVPLISTTGTIRGALEGQKYFRYANWLQVAGSSGHLFIPASAALFTDRIDLLFAIVFFFRLWVLAAGIRRLRSLELFDFGLHVPRQIFSDSLWITGSIALSSLCLFSDRWFIGAFGGLSQVAYYSTPMDIAMRILVIPQAISRILLPLFASSSLDAAQETLHKTGKSSLFLMMILVFPPLWILAGWSELFLKIWLGTEFAQQSHLLLAIFCLGLLWNCMTWIPFNLGQAMGLFRDLLWVQLIGAGFYFLALFSFQHQSVTVLAMLWSFRFVIDAILFFGLLRRRTGSESLVQSQRVIALLLGASVLWAGQIFINFQGHIFFGIFYNLLILFAFILWVWRTQLDAGAKAKIKNLLLLRIGS
jgi:O-antigen/teichoic acid export membrane protein